MSEFITYKEKLKGFSRRLIDAQKPIRILNSIRTPQKWEDKLIKSKFKELPGQSRTYFEENPLDWDTEKTAATFRELKVDLSRVLGKDDDLGKHLAQVCDQYLTVIDMLNNRGKPEFYKFSRELYGSTKDCFAQDSNTIADMAHLLYGTLTGIGATLPGPVYPENIGAETVVAELNKRFIPYFGEGTVLTKLSDGIVADAAAGGDKIKIREGAMFSQRDIEIYEVHEGWVHVGTTLNGRAQPVCEFLSIGPPRCACTQEGLAVLMEIFTFRSFIQRARQINDRILCIEKAENGANLLEVIEYLRTEGYTERECLTHALRVFRGGMIEGGAPFTKDISYCKGFVENYNFLRSAIRVSRPYLIPFLFSGKLHVEDVPLLYAKYLEGLVEAPKFLPQHFSDLNGLAVWMSFSSFLNQVDLQSVQAYYRNLFNKYL